MQRLINRYGEINIIENMGILKMPYSRLAKDANKRNLSEAYIEGIKRFGMNDLIIYSTDLNDNGNYFEMKYDLKNKRPFIDIRNFDFVQQLALFNSIIEIGRIESTAKQQILWEKENFLFDADTGKIRALLFEFERFPLYIIKNSVEGVKSLIFLTLTNLDKIDRKPTRNDFIDQSAKIIDFANKILIAKTLDDIEKVVNNTLEYEISLIEMREKEQEKKQGKIKKTLFKTKKKTETEKIDYKAQLKQQLASKANLTPQRKADNRPFSQRMADKMLTPKGGIILVAMASILLFGAYVLPKYVNSDQAELKAKEQQKTFNETIKAYRAYIMGDKERAYADLDSIGYEKLNDQDKKVLLQFYLEQGKYTKALETYPNYAYTIGDKLVKEGNKEDLEKLAIASDNKVLKFDLAAANKEYQSVINLAQDLDKINERRANEIVKAYYLTNQESELEDFINAKEKLNQKKNSQELANEIMALTTVQQDLYTLYTSYRDLDSNYNSLLKKMNHAKANNTQETKNLQVKVSIAKEKRDEAYNQIQQSYTTVSYTNN